MWIQCNRRSSLLKKKSVWVNVLQPKTALAQKRIFMKPMTLDVFFLKMGYINFILSALVFELIYLFHSLGLINCITAWPSSVLAYFVVDVHNTCTLFAWSSQCLIHATESRMDTV